MIKKTYLINNLDCANCAAKIEKKLNDMPEIYEAKIVFATKRLIITAQDPDKLLPNVIKTISQIEPSVLVVQDQETKKLKRPYVKSHKHDEKCGCHITDSGVIERIYKVENLCCRICSEKIEQKIIKLPYVKDVCLTFTTNQLRISSEKDPDTFFDEIQKICESIKHDVSLSSSNDKHSLKDRKTDSELIKIISGAILFLAGIIISHFAPLYISTVLFFIAYVILGLDVIVSAVSNLFHGQIFDENFLMTVATIGAFVIGESSEAVGIMLFFKIGELFEHRAVEKSRQSIISAIDVRPDTVSLIVDGKEIPTYPENVSIGDIILVKNGDRVALDGVIIEGTTKMDTSAITGESIPVNLTKGKKAVSGYINSLSPVKIKVENTLQNSMVSRILESVENAAANKPKIDRFLTRFARIYTPIVVLVALLVALVPPFLFKGDFNYWIYTALSFLVISCPCALVLSVPLAFFAGIGRASQNGILLKGGSTLESLCSIKAVVMDKTGTITKGNFVVQRVKVNDQTQMSADDLLSIAASIEKSSNHPIAHSICNYARERKIKLLETENVKEIAGRGMESVIDGSTVICGNKKFFIEHNVKVPNEKFFGTEVFLARDSNYLGYIEISDTVKSDAVKTISDLKSKNFFTAIVTGDSKSNSQAVFEKVLTDDLYAELLPQDKLDVVKKIRKEHGPVMFVGDGINDAPVIAGADVGAAMGSGSDFAIEMADIIYMNSNVYSVKTSIDIANAVEKVAKQNVFMALGIKTAIMILGLIGLASMWTAVFADTGVAVLCILNSIKLLKR